MTAVAELDSLGPPPNQRLVLVPENFTVFAGERVKVQIDTIEEAGEVEIELVDSEGHMMQEVAGIGSALEIEIPPAIALGSYVLRARHNDW